MVRTKSSDENAFGFDLINEWPNDLNLLKNPVFMSWGMIVIADIQFPASSFKRPPIKHSQ